MTEEQKELFEKLSEKRKQFAKLSQDPDYRGMWEVLIKGIYSEDAHFIYELLQNAEDVKATFVKFILQDDGLYFIHNGTVTFTITDIDNSNENGHINAITAVGRTGKKISETIGKFGIGFKAVFQYTLMPHIYDPNFQFKIYDYIIPELLESETINIQYDKSKETVFYFPFISESEQTDNNRVKSKIAAYQDISAKLKVLDKPTLFLSNLKEITWQIGNESNNYKKEVIETEQKEHIKLDRIKLSPNNEDFLILTRSHKENVGSISVEYSYSIGFKVEGDKLKPISDSSAYCFFTTTQKTNLNFIFHAPFLLNSNREAIPINQTLKIKDDNGNEHTIKDKFNESLIGQLAQLAADSLLILKDLKLIDDDIIKIIPYKEPEENDFFAPFYETIKAKFETEELLPAKDGSYAKKDNAYWASVPKLAELFSNEQLTDIIEDKEINKWVFASKGRDEILRGDKELADYIDSITNIWLNEEDILTGWSYDNGIKQEGVLGNFIEKQNDEWLISFYKWIADTEGRKKLAKDKSFFLNQERKAVSAFDKNDKLRIFLPDNDGEGYDTINADLFKKTESVLVDAEKQKGKSKQQANEEITSLAKVFYEKFGIRDHTVADEIEESIVRFKNNQLNSDSFFAKAFKYFKNECPQDKIDDFIEKIKNLTFVPFKSKNETFGASTGNALLYPTEKLIEFYEQITDTKFVNIEELQEKYSNNDYKTLDNFLKKLGVKDKDPELKDEIYNIILPQYKKNGRPTVNTIDEGVKHLKTLLEYYQKCPNNEIVDFIKNLKSLRFLYYTKIENTKSRYWGEAQNLYYPTPDLKKYFKTKPDTKFIDLGNYYKIITNEKEQEILNEFLLKLGVSTLPKILEIDLSWEERGKLNLEYGSSTYSSKTTQTIIDGCLEILNNIDKEKSLLLWEFLGKLQYKIERSLGDGYFLNKKLTGNHSYFYYTWRYQSFESLTITHLKSKKWLVNQSNKFIAPHEITITELADEYVKNTELEGLLEFRPILVLSEEQAKLKYLEDNNIDLDGLKDFMEWKNRKNNTRTSSNSDYSHNNDDYDKNISKQTQKSRIDRTIQDLDDLQNQFTQNPEKIKKENEEPESKPEISFDEDEEFAKGFEDLKKQFEIKKSRVELAENINISVKYSYDWFKAYLQLLTTYGEKQDTTKQKSISFQEIKPFTKDNKYFLLSGASSYISPEIENADDFKVSLVFGGGKKENITVEGVSKKGQDLLIYCREPLSSNTLSRLSNIFKVEINFTPVIDLLDRLYKAFTNSNYIDEWQDIKEAMPSLKYIYGPPGTGKTTTLCNNINKILGSNPYAKFLVLTPTNKAADVVCKKLQDINPDVCAVRLSRPTDPELEKQAIYRDTLDDEDMQSVDVLASTIHRLPYFDIKNIGLLFQYNWDYVIFDEASMTGLHYITFAIMSLFKSNPETKFIIAGDPKQIPPVIGIDDKELENFDFQDENIYKMMNLESFNPEEQIIREIDTIQNLDKQYRSIPQIGQLFSELSYSSLLKHDRATNRKEAKPLPEKFKNLISSNVTFVDIPLNQDNSIYKVNKLFYSSYHTYCAILVSEIIRYFDSVNKEEQWSIGLIAPYKAQAILLNKLITSYGISENVKVFSDTVHGFQGDECDIVFFVCNPNNYFYSGHEKALLSKEYIYNVAISRAKDYLIILHPYTAIQNNNFINKIGLSYKNNFGNTKILNAKDFERVLFNDETYIENNSYVSGHDSVNVFGLSEMKYFIKSNDTAIDIQLRDLQKEKTSKELMTQNNFIEVKAPKLEGLKIVGHIDLTQFEKYGKNKPKGSH